MHRKYGRSEDRYVTADLLARLKRTLANLEERERPQAIEDVTRAREMGDLSENAAYTEAKGRLRRIEGRIFSLQERIKYAVVIRPEENPDGIVGIGSTVVVSVNGKEKTYQVLGSQETNPSAGRISHLSPLGKALLRRKAGDEAVVETEGRKIVYHIIEVR
jgi:transcription elongation factor GreA